MLPERGTLPEQRYRVLAICSHPVQYMAPVLRRMAHHPQLNLHVAYCSLRGAEPVHDPDFDTTIQWDVPLLDGYEWVEIPNRGSGSDGFFGLYNPGLAKLIRRGKFDAVSCYVSYRCASFWLAYFACRFSGTAFVFGTDASSLVPRSASRWKLAVKKLLWPSLFARADQVIVPSSATRDLMLSLRIPAERITLTPYSVDNDWWRAQSAKVDRHAVRQQWGVESSTVVILFCGKLQPWKRPMDLLHAFARLDSVNAFLVFAGEGPLRPLLESEAVSLGVADRVRFLGFKNQSQLPAVYTAVDLLVLPSDYEPFAVVVNEASCCGCAVATSDHVGAARDLVAPVNPGLIYPCGDLEALATIFRNILSRPAQLPELGRAAREHLENWSPRETVAGTVEAVARAVKHARS
jgi:glycosyltransferase involved in cell wall biosynthesis